MKLRVIPFGEAGQKEKIRIVDGIVASRPYPPFLYNDVLIMAPSSRLKRLYGKLFLDAVERRGSIALVQPDVMTFHQFLQKQFARMNGPRLIDENARMILLEGLVKKSLSGSNIFNQSPDQLAPSLATALAATIEQLSSAGVGHGDLAMKIEHSELSDKPQVTLLLDLYEQYEKVLEQRMLADPAGLKRYLLKNYSPSWIAQYRLIIIDGIHTFDSIEAELIRKVTASDDCLYIVQAPSSELLAEAAEYHPLAILRTAVSQTGCLPGTSSATISTDDAYLATALFSDKPFDEVAANAPEPSSFSKKISLLSAVNSRDEVSLIAAAVKNSLKRGVQADSILVAFPGLDEYAALVEELFTDFGIPYNRALGRQLSSSPVAQAVVSLLSCCQEDFTGPSLLRSFSSPFLKFSSRRELAPALDRFLRMKKISGGRRRILSALRFFSSGSSAEEQLSKPLNELFANLEPFTGPDTAPLSEWMKRLAQLLSWSELQDRVMLIKGALNTNLQAYRKLNEVLLSLNAAGNLFPDYLYTFNEWLFLLKKTFMHARFQVPPEDEGGVQILGLEESVGHFWSEIYLGGLVEGAFPGRLPPNIFLPEQMLEKVGVRTLERARSNAAYHFYRLLLSADTVLLTWPENHGERPMVPSPFLKELTPLLKAGVVNRGLDKTAGIQFSLKINESRSVPELAKAVSLAAHQSGGRAASLSELLALLAEEMPDCSPEIHAMTKACADKPSGPVIFRTPSSGHKKLEFSVTGLDAYLNCPYDYYAAEVLGIKPLQEVTEDISPLERGSKVHGILSNFYHTWGTDRPLSRNNRGEAAGLLKKLANAAFDGEADTFRNRREKLLFLTIMTERFLDAEEAFWRQGMKPLYLEQKIESFGLVLSNGEEVQLSAKIDRIDVDEKGDFVVVDYKTGSYPLPKNNADQDIFQLPVYAVMAQQAFSKTRAGNNTPLRNPIGLAYYDLSGKTGAIARDVVLFNKEERNDHSSSKPRTSPKSAEEFKAIFTNSMDKARRAVEGILSRNFRPMPLDENRCRYCPYTEMCSQYETGVE